MADEEEDTIVLAACEQEVEEDVHSCGKCKRSFTSIMSFVEHKKSDCSSPAKHGYDLLQRNVTIL